MMSIACWRNEYCTKNQQIDHEHQELFQIVNRLHDAMLRREDQSVLKGILETLAIHTIEHFQTEEAMMQSHHYPGYGRHKQAHDGLKVKVALLLQKFDHSETAITVGLTSFLTEWLVHHIKGEDQKMIQFFRTPVENQAVAGMSQIIR